MNRIQQTTAPKSRREGTVTKRSKGSYQIRYSVADADGERKQVNETVKGTKKDAEKVLRERLASLDNGHYVDKSKETVSQFMARWMETYAATNVSLRTAHGYEGYIHRYIDPTIGKIALQSLTPSQVQKVYADMLERGLSNTTVLHLHRVLREALGHAVKWGIITRNVADATSPPRQEQKQMEMWNIPTIHDFLDLSQGSKYGDVFNFAIHTGLRRSEICGLKWDSVDLLEGRLSVVGTLHSINGHGLVEGLPKTKRSRRSMSLASETVELLHAIKGSQIAQALPSTGYVFTRPNGLPLIPQEVTKEFTRFIRKHGLPYLTFHGLRHANATLQLAAGINPKVVSEGLGHSTVGITLDLYSHVLPNMQQHAAEAVAKLLKRE